MAFLVTTMQTARRMAAAVFLGTLAIAAVLGCHNVFNNPVDPAATAYQGYPTVGTLAEITATSPADGATVPSATDLDLSLSAVVGATAYQVQVSLSQQAFDTAIVYDSGTGTTNAVTVPAASVWSGIFYWRGRGAIQAGQWGAWSPVVSYSVIAQLPTLGNWQQNATSFTTARGAHTSVVSNGYLYVIDGDNGTIYYGDVSYARINADSSLGPWGTTTAPSVGRSRHASVVYGGRLYVMGGYTGSAQLADVQYASINTNGSLGTWQTGAPFTTVRQKPTSVAYNGYIYVIGGLSGTTYLSDVQYAPVNADGSLGSWASTTPFATARDSHASVANNGYLYVIGGYGTGRLGDVQYAPINANGAIGVWTNTTALPSVRSDLAAVASGGYLYVIGGNGASWQLSDVLYAPINADGSIGGWTSTSSLPNGRAGHSAVLSQGHLYVTGGWNGASYLNDVQYAAFDTGAPSTTTTLPAPTISPNGGVVDTAPATVTITDSVAAASIRYTTDGSTPSPTSGTQLQSPGTIQVTPPATVKAIAYLSGIASSAVTTAQFIARTATPTFTPTSGILSGSVNVTISCGTSAASIRYTTDFSTPTSTSGTLYSGPFTVYSATTVRAIAYKSGYADSYVGLKDYGPAGAIGGYWWYWSANELPIGRYGHACVILNGRIYVVGGTVAGTAFSSDVMVSPIPSGGGVGPWTTSTASLPAGRNSHAAAGYSSGTTGYLYAIGGKTSSNDYSSDVYYAAVGADGSVGTWTSGLSLPTGRYGHSAVVSGGYLYVIGGNTSSTSYSTNVLVAPITNGIPGAWTTNTAALPIGRSNHAAVTSGTYIYVIGGNSSSATYASDVLYGAVGTGGSVATWNTGTSLSVGRNSHAAAAAGGYLYVFGGQTSSTSYSADVLFAPVNATTGSVGSWVATTSMVNGLNEFAAAAVTGAEGGLYVVGGLATGATPANDVWFSWFIQ